MSHTLSQTEWWMVVVAVVSVVLAGLLTASEAALQSFSKSRAEALVKEGHPQGPRLLQMMQDPAPYLNTVTLLRVIFEVLAIVLVALVVFDHFDQLWQQLLISVGIMGLVSFIILGVSPRTLGRQHATSLAIASARPVSALTTVFAPIAQVMIIIGNMVTPGRGFTDGPFTSEAELRELVDIAEASPALPARKRDAGDRIWTCDCLPARRRVPALLQRADGRRRGRFVCRVRAAEGKALQGGPV